MKNIVYGEVKCLASKPPKKTQYLWHLLGLLYQRYIKDFSRISYPLVQFLKNVKII